MIKWALTFIVNRLIFLMVFLLALNAFTPRTNHQYGNSHAFMKLLTDLPAAVDTLNKSFH